jgi:hypothetical protein
MALTTVENKVWLTNEGTVMSTRIRWTEQEKLALAAAAVEYQRLFPKAVFIRMFTEAQFVLPEDRRRKVTCRSEVSWAVEYMQKAKDAKSIDSLFANSIHTVEAQAAPVETLPAPPPEPQTIVPEVPTLDPYTMPLQDLMGIYLSRTFSETMQPMLDAMCSEYLSKKAAAMIEEIQVMRGEKGRVQIVVPEAVKRAMRPKVLILGLLGSQVTIVKQQYDKLLDLTLIGSDKQHDGLISLAKSHDVGIVMTRFINHSQQDQVRRNAPHTIFVSGTTTEVTNILHSLVHNGQDSLRAHNYSTSKTFVTQ